MNIEVTRDNVTILEQSETPHENEYKITTCYFTFDEFTDSFQVKRAIFTILSTEEMYETDIINNQCDIPSEVLKHEYETVKLGVYGYNIGDNEELLNRFSPSYAEIVVPTGSYKEGALSPEPITPSQYDLYSQALQEGLQEVDDKLDEVVETVDGKIEEVDNKLIDVDTTVNNKMTEVDNKIGEVDDKLDEVDDKITEVDTAITETNNLNLDVSDKVDGDVTVTLTKKDASTKSVVISDGTSLQFMWQGTSLGIKTDDMQEYVFVDLQGIQGVPGPQGEPFRIKKTYSSVAEMNADFNNMQYGDYVMIASTVEVEDNAKLYTRGEREWIFITDFSGAQGIKGETGATPNIQIGTVTSGSVPSVTRTGTNENPVLNFVLQPGEKGNTGDTGATGNGIASITKTSTTGLVDTYTITFTDGNTTTFNVENGNGIDHISLTSQSGATKVYTIYYTDGTTSEYTVQDGEVTQEVFDEEVDRLKMVYNAMPKVSGEGTDLTLNNTAECPVYEVGLSPSELKQATTSISEGDEYDSPSPEHPQEIHTVSGENTVVVGNENLFDTSAMVLGDLDNNTGEELTTTGNTHYRSGYILVLPNTSYVFTTNYTYTAGVTKLMEYGSDKSFVGRNAQSSRNQTIIFTTSATTYYLRICMYSSPAFTDFYSLENMLIEGTTATTYEPHKEQNLPLSLGDLEYCKIGDYEDLFFKNVVGSEYYDSTLVENKWYLKKNIGKVVLDGSEGWVIFNSSSSRVTFRTIINDIEGYTNGNTIPNIISNRFIPNSYNVTWVIGNVSRTIASGGQNFVLFVYEPNTTVEQFKEWLSSNNTEVYYILNTPTYTLLSDTLQTQLDNIQKAITYQDQTNVSQTNADLPFVIKLSAIRDLSGIFELIQG